MSSIITIQEWKNQNIENSEADERLFLSEEEVRSFPQFKNASSEEIENIIATLHDLALVTYELFCKEEGQKANAVKSEQDQLKSCEPIRVLSLMPIKSKSDDKINQPNRKKRRL